MTIYKPTAAECRIIREVATKQARREGCGTKKVRIELGERYNTESDRGLSINLRIVSDHENWDDTDLNQTLGWEDFKKGFSLSNKGEAEIDFYLYEEMVKDHGGLVCNIQALWKTIDGKVTLVRMDADADEGIWSL